MCLIRLRLLVLNEYRSGVIEIFIESVCHIGCHVDLEGCLYVPGCARNLVSVAKCNELGFSFKIGKQCIFFV